MVVFIIHAMLLQWLFYMDSVAIVFSFHDSCNVATRIVFMIYAVSLQWLLYMYSVAEAVILYVSVAAVFIIYVQCRCSGYFINTELLQWLFKMYRVGAVVILYVQIYGRG